MSTATHTHTRADLVRALAVLAEPPGPQHARLADLLRLPMVNGRDWTEAFMVQLVPYSSVYLSADGMLGGEAADRVAGFWRALRRTVPAEPDHLVTLLGLYAALLEAERDEAQPARRSMWRQAHTALLHEHLLSWIPAFAAAMADAGPPAYAAWAALLREAVLDQAAEAGRPDRLPLHLRAVPVLAEPGDDLEALLDALLAPARSGLILTRAHLGRAGQRAGLGVRLGDRRQMLRTLIRQDPAATLGMLADQAQTWAVRHRADEPATGCIGVFLAGRAAATADLLRSAAVSIVDAPVLDGCGPGAVSQGEART